MLSNVGRIVACFGILIICEAASANAEEFSAPKSGGLYLKAAGGSAGGVSQFGLGTSPSNFTPLLSGLPSNPSLGGEVFAGYVNAGQTVHFGMYTTFGSGAYAFSNGTDSASQVVFRDTNNSLGSGGSILEQTSANTWLLHLDDARSSQFDDDDNDVLISLRLDSGSANGPPASTGPVVSAVVNGASFIQGSIAPGTIISIFGTGLARNTVSASTLPLPNTLDGTSVSIGGQALPLFFVSATQINAQMPFQVTAGPAQLMVRDSSGAVTSHPIAVAPGSPAIFTSTSDGKGEAIAVHADFTRVKRASLEYALAGETIILFCTGLGSVQNFNTAGVGGPTSPLAHTIIRPTILMDGRPAQITFSGLAPGFVGLYQINVVVPSEVGGNVVTTLRVGEAVSNEVTINVAGTYTLAENYAGLIDYKTGNRFQLELSSFRPLSPSLDGGNYRLLNAGSVIDNGTFEVQSTQTVFLARGRSSVTGQPFVGVMDTLDAGHSFFGLLYNSDSLDKVQDANDWYAGFEVTAVEPEPPVATPPPVLPGIPSSCAAVEGALIFADDGTFLGRITSNTFARDSIGNEFGPYGSEFSPTSIFNEFGRYGGEFSSTSAFNDFATRPPIIFINQTAVAYLTTNEFKSPRIDPRALFPCIGR